MPRDLEHLELPRVQGSLPRRLSGGGRPVPRADRRGHGRRLAAELDGVVETAGEAEHPRGVDPDLIFKVELHERGYLDEEVLGRMGLSVLAREPDRVLVVFASDRELHAFRRRLASYSGDVEGPAYSELGGIERLLPLTVEDRTGRRLREEPLSPDAQEVPLDVELWHPGLKADAEAVLRRFATAVGELGGRLTDSLLSTDLLLTRVRLDADALNRLLRIDWVREVDRIPNSGVAPSPLESLPLAALPTIAEPPEGSVGVLVIDSGLTPRHPLLQNLIGEAAAFPGPSGPTFSELDTETSMGGHGTAVAGLAGLGSLERLVGQPSVNGVRLFSARVLDDECCYNADQLAEHQLEAALRHFLDTYPECRVINISLGDPMAVLREGDRQFRLSARIDELAWEMRDRNVLFVICSGNYETNPGDLDHGLAYGRHFADPGARLIEPATAALALTVGGVAGGRSPAAPDRRAVAGVMGFPSPFTRRGPGLEGAVKPDVAEVAGDLALDASGRLVAEDPSLGVLTTNRAFAPPAGELLRRVVGTSFAAPAVAHLAARLFDAYEGASPNLIRALIADSARLPASRPSELSGEPWEENVWRIYGHGMPNLERAAFSAENEVLLLAESSIDLDGYELFQIPEIPTDFLARKGERELSVTLAFDPPTRQSRADSYLGVRMKFYLFRNIGLAAIESLFRDWSKAPAGPTEEALEEKMDSLKGRHKVNLRPGSTVRGRGTLQKGVCRISKSNWSYDGGPLILAVTSQRKWAPAAMRSQRYAVVASLKHSDPEARLHSRLRQRLQVRPRARLRV